MDMLIYKRLEAAMAVALRLAQGGTYALRTQVPIALYS